MDNFGHKCVFAFVIWLVIITPISTKQSARPPSLPRISVWDMILCIPDNYFYSPRLSDSLREITPGWLLDTGVAGHCTVHIGWEIGRRYVISRHIIAYLISAERLFMTPKTCVIAKTGQLCSGQGPKEWQLTTPNPVTRKVKCKLIPQICSLQKDLILISGEGWRLGDHSQLWPSQNQDWASLQGIIFRRNVSNQRNPSLHSDAPVYLWPSHLTRPQPDAQSTRPGTLARQKVGSYKLHDC